MVIFPYRFIKREDITIVMAIKDIDEKYLINCLSSIREQTYKQSLIEIILVDYGSEMRFSSLYRGICGQYRVKYIKAYNKPVWSRANALNIGIRKARTKYILIADIDIIFEKNYIEEGIKELKRDPFQIIVNAMLDLPDITIEGKDYNELRSLVTPRYNWEYHPSINLTFTKFYRQIRGYDEAYRVYGSEDDDMMKRFRLFGLAIRSIKDHTSYLHQYHEKFRNVKGIKRLKEIIALNRYYYNNTDSIVRNQARWGEM